MRFRYRHLVLSVLAVIAYAQVSAQDDDDSTGYEYLHPKLFQGRLLGGFNFCQVDGDAYAGYHKVGLNLGGMVYAHFTPSIGTSLEMVYTQKGVRGANVKESYTVGTYFDKYYLNLNYVEAALLFHIDLFLFDFEGGFSYAQLVKSDEWAEADVPIVIDPKLTYFNSYDIDYVLGLSMRINKRWSVNMRYQYSLTSIRPWDRVPPRYSNGAANEFNEVVNLRLEYKIR